MVALADFELYLLGDSMNFQVSYRLLSGLNYNINEPWPRTPDSFSIQRYFLPLTFGQWGVKPTFCSTEGVIKQSLQGNDCLIKRLLNFTFYFGKYNGKGRLHRVAKAYDTEIDTIMPRTGYSVL